MTIAQLPPFDLRVVYPWMQPDAVFAASFPRGEYWLDAAGGPIAASSLLTTTRSSGINLPNAEGVFQTLGNDTLPRTDRGLYANGQIAALNANGNNPQSGTGWNNVSSASSNGPLVDGFFNSVYVASNGNTSGGRQANPISVQAGVPVGIKMFFRPGIEDSGGVFFFVQLAPGVFSSAQGPRGAASVVNSSAGPLVIVSQFPTHIFAIWTPNATLTTASVRGGPFSNEATRDILLLGIDVTNTPFIPEALVSTGSPAPTLLASDIRAVQGVRPSNSQSEPFPGWEAAGLDDAVAGKAVVNIDRLNASAARFITGAGVDADNLWRLIFDTDNRFKMVVRKSGVDEVTLQTGAVAATGDKTIEWQAKPGDYAIAATGVAGDTDSDGATLPAGATTLRVGSNFGALTPFNGWISEIQIARAA